MRPLPLCLLLTAVVLVPGRMKAVTFSGLGDVAGGSFFSNALSISDNGLTVVGQSTGGTNTAFVWTQAGGMKALYNTNSNGSAYKVSGNGLVAVGRDTNAGDNGVRAFSKVISGSFTYLGGLAPTANPPNQGRAWSANTDASVIVGSVAYTGGSGNEQAFRYTGGTLTGLGFLGSPNGISYGSQALDVSGDGGVIVGFSTSSAGQSAFRYTTAGGMTDLGRFTPGDTSYYAANAISTNGNVIVGRNLDTGPFTWTQGGGMLKLTSFSTVGNALDVNADGSLIVGVDQQGGVDQNTIAVFWRNGVEFRLKDYLVSMGNTSVAGWDLRTATGVSADGFTICGTGVDPSGFTEAFIVNIQSVPEPAAFAPVLLALAGGVAWWTRRARGTATPTL